MRAGERLRLGQAYLPCLRMQGRQAPRSGLSAVRHGGDLVASYFVDKKKPPRIV